MEIEITPKTNSFQALYWPIRTLIFYVFFMVVWKIAFAFHNEVESTWSCIKLGFRLDLSMASGVILVGFIPWIVFLLSGWQWIRKWMLISNLIVWIGISIIEYASNLMYHEWGGTLDARAISYLSHPREAWATSSDFVSFWPSIVALGIFVSGLKGLWMHYQDWSPVRSYYFQSWIFVLLVGPLSFLFLRGGMGKWPITPSDAFFSEKMNQNFTAVNKTWYFLYSIVKFGNLEYTTSDDELSSYKSRYLSENGCNPDPVVISMQGKSIVLIIAEGWSCDMVRYLGGKENVTPFFDSLADVSIRFDSVYSSGFRTDQGLASILSGVPSIAGNNLLNRLDKAKEFPSLCSTLEREKYQTGFVYGGDLNFANMFNFLTNQGFNTIISERDFDKSELKTEWGVPDHITANRAIQTLQNTSEPFFLTWMQLSSHVPFEIPIPNHWKRSDIPTKYKSSVFYSDQSMHTFFDEAKSQPWYKNTIFIITSDHGSNHSGLDNNTDERYHVPLIIFDPSMVRSLSVKNIGNHFDLPSTILAQLGIDNQSFVFGRNLFCQNPKKKAYWSNDVRHKSVGKTEDDSFIFFDMVKQWYNAL